MHPFESSLVRSLDFDDDSNLQLFHAGLFWEVTAQAGNFEKNYRLEVFGSEGALRANAALDIRPTEMAPHPFDTSSIVLIGERSFPNLLLFRLLESSAKFPVVATVKLSLTGQVFTDITNLSSAFYPLHYTFLAGLERGYLSGRYWARGLHFAAPQISQSHGLFNRAPPLILDSSEFAWERGLGVSQMSSTRNALYFIETSEVQRAWEPQSWNALLERRKAYGLPPPLAGEQNLVFFDPKRKQVRPVFKDRYRQDLRLLTPVSQGNAIVVYEAPERKLHLIEDQSEQIAQTRNDTEIVDIAEIGRCLALLTPQQTILFVEKEALHKTVEIWHLSEIESLARLKGKNSFAIDPINGTVFIRSYAAESARGPYGITRIAQPNRALARQCAYSQR